MGDGLHLMLDGLADKIPARRAVRALLEAMPETIGMTPIGDPSIHRAGAGWVGMQLIAESHISVHCKGREVHVDVFSCKVFATIPAIDLVVRTLGLDPVRTQTIKRGWEV